MRSFCTGILLTAGVAWLAADAWAQSPAAKGPQLQAYRPAYGSPYSSSLVRHQPEAVAVPEAVSPPPVMMSPANEPTMYDQDMGGWGDDDCTDCMPSCCDGTWFASFAGLVMTRDNPNPFWTTYETNNNVNQLMSTKDAEAEWSGGGELRFGRWWCGCCARTGLEVSYFTLDPLEGFSSIRDVNNELSTPIDLNTQTGTVDIGARPAAEFFDNAREHRIWRNDEIHNVEINVLRQKVASCSRGQVTWLAGVRFFRFDESLIFGAVAGDNAITPNAEFGNNGGVDEAYLDVRCENNLIGFQIGARADYNCTARTSVFAVPKFGVYGNDINARSRLYAGNGDQGFDIVSNEDDISILASIDLGLSYQCSPRWRVFGGYRAIAVTGIALSDNQIPAFLAAADEFEDIDTNGDLILHGGFAGVECRY